MQHKTFVFGLAVAVIAGGLLATPVTAEAQGKGNSGKHSGRNDDRGHNRGRDNRGRNDDRNRGRVNDGRNRQIEQQRREAEMRRRQEEQRRQAEMRRRYDDDRRRRDYEARRRYEEDRRRREAEERRRQEEIRRRNDSRYRGSGSEYDRRQQTKNEWRNLAIASGAVAVLGLLQKDNTLVFAGAAGALYSLHRYEQDRKSQNSLNRARAHYFGQDHFYRDGVRYDRRVVNKNGQRYYQFVRG